MSELLGIEDQGGKNDRGNNNKEHEKPKHTGTGAQGRDDDLESGVVVEEATETHDTNGSYHVPGWMDLVVVLEQEGIVDEVAVEPKVGDEIDPVKNALEELDLVRGYDVLDGELDREPCNADVLDVVKDCWMANAAAD